MKRFLLDVNVLIALFDPTHVHHQLAHDWFADHRSHGWATCPLTQNGFIRILTIPSHARAAVRAVDLSKHLDSLCSAVDHEFWTDSISLLDTTRFDLSGTGHRHLTDVYLAGLAHANGGTLATFDRSIPVKAVIGAGPDALTVIRP